MNPSLTKSRQQRLDVGCLRRVSPDLHHDILHNLHKLSFTSMSAMGGTRHHFTRGGRLVASKQIVYSIAADSSTPPVSTMNSPVIFNKNKARMSDSCERLVSQGFNACYF